MKLFKLILIGLFALGAPILFSLQAVNYAKIKERSRQRADTIMTQKARIAMLIDSVNNLKKLIQRHPSSAVSSGQNPPYGTNTDMAIIIDRCTIALDSIRNKYHPNTSSTIYIGTNRYLHKLDSLDILLKPLNSKATKISFPESYRQAKNLLAEIDSFKNRIKHGKPLD